MMAALLLASCTASRLGDDGGNGDPDGVKLSAKIDVDLAPILEAQETPVGIVVQVGDEIVYERYHHTTPAQYRDMASVTKSVVSILVGIALQEGHLESTDQTLAELLPDYAKTMAAPVAATTLRDVLTMTGGFVGELDPEGFTFTGAKDPVREILAGTVASPRRQFIYSSAGPHLVSVILETATGMTVLDYARTRLFDPLGIPSRPAAQGVLDGPTIDAYYRTDFAWPVDDQHHQLGWARLRLRPRDMAKLGALYLNGGRYHGQQLVPRKWVRDSTSAQVDVNGIGPAHSYGYQWWVDDGDGDRSFQAWGFGGQKILVVPARRLVLAISQDFDMRDADVDGTGVAPEITDVVLAALDESRS